MILTGLKEAISKRFWGLPYDKMSEIKICIKPPKAAGDPGQMISLWKSINDVLELLSSIDGIRRLTVHLHERWSVGGVLNRSIQEEVISNGRLTPGYEADINLVLLPLRRIRNVQKSCIWFQKRYMSADGRRQFLDGFTDKPEVIRQGFLKERTPEDLETLGKVIDKVHCELENVLPGGTANMLRLERFLSWYTDAAAYNQDASAYLTSHQKRIDQGEQKWKKRNQKSVEWRMRMMHAFNPRSACWQAWRFMRNQLAAVGG